MEAPYPLNHELRSYLTSQTYSRGKVTQNAYDNQGNLLSTTDPLNHTTTYAYLPSGLPKTVADAREQCNQLLL